MAEPEKITDQPAVTMTFGDILAQAERRGDSVVLALIKEITRLRREVAERDKVIDGQKRIIAAAEKL